MKFFAFLLSLILFNNVKCQENQCYQLQNNPYSLFASKTMYNSLVSDSQNFTQPNCKTLQLWMLIRHGTRHPDDDKIEKISKLIDYAKTIKYDKSSLCPEDIRVLKEWTYNLTKNDGCVLNSQGVRDLSDLGTRLKNLYKDVFDEAYNTTTYKVLSSPKTRCVDSAFHFLRSAFNLNVTDIPIRHEDDTRINISKFKKITDDDDSDGSGVKEVKIFESSLHLAQLITRVSKTLGLESNMTIGTLITMYEACRFEKALYINSRPAWCAVFSEEDLKVIEYNEDLRNYYYLGYGNPMNKRMSCPLIRDLITNFREKSQGKPGPKGVFFFAHSANVLSTIAGLGLAKDSSSPLGTNYEEMGERKWRTSYLDPFMSNVIAALYECNGVRKVTFFVNEIPIFMEKYGCTLCPWETVEKMFDSIVSSPECMLDQSTSSASLITKTIALVFFGFAMNIFTSFN